jgi:hypothetical protein
MHPALEQAANHFRAVGATLLTALGQIHCERTLRLVSEGRVENNAPVPFNELFCLCEKRSINPFGNSAL